MNEKYSDKNDEFFSILDNKLKGLKDYILPVTIYSMLIGFNIINGYLSEYGIEFPMGINLYVLFIIATFYSVFMVASFYLIILGPKFFVPKGFSDEFKKAINLNIWWYGILIAALPISVLVLLFIPSRPVKAIAILFGMASLITNFIIMNKSWSNHKINKGLYIKNISKIVFIKFSWLLMVLAIAGVFILKLPNYQNLALIAVFLVALYLHYMMIMVNVKPTSKPILFVIFGGLLALSFHPISSSFLGGALLKKLNIGGGKTVFFQFKNAKGPSNFSLNENNIAEVQLLLSLKDYIFVKLEGDPKDFVYTLKKNDIEYTFHEKPKQLKIDSKNQRK